MSFIAFRMWLVSGRDPAKFPSREDVERIDPEFREMVMQWNTIYEWSGDTGGYQDALDKAKEAAWKRRQS